MGADRRCARAAPAVAALIAAMLLAAPPSAGAQGAAGPARRAPAEPDTAARMAAILALGQSGDRASALPALIAALKDPNRDVRWVAIEALGDLGDRRAVPALVQYLAARRTEAYRWSKRLIANALGAIGGPEAMAALTSMIEDSDPFVRRNAALSLLQKRDPALLARLEPLLRENPDDHLAAVKQEFATVRQAATSGATKPRPPAPAAPAPIRPHEWAGLKVNVTRTADVVERIGAPLQQTADSLLFRGNAMPSAIPTESVVVNTSDDGLVASIFVFPLWGTLDRDVRAVLGPGRILTYGEFLRMTARTSFGSGTRVEGKLHYLPPDLLTESFPDLGILVVYDSADVAARDRLVKLLIVY